MNIKAILLVSLLANVLLAGYALRPQPPAPSLTETPVKAPKTEASVPSKPRVDKQMVTNTITKQITWEMVESGDYKEYIQNLRTIGCPDETIRDIILADVNKLYDRKKKELRGDKKKFEYWKGGNPFMGVMDSDLMKKMKVLDDEKNAVLQALGITPDARTEMAQVMNPLDAMMDFLPEDKKVRLMKIMSDMQAKMAEANKDGGNDMEAMGKAMKDMEKAVKATLTPDEYLDYQLRFSMTANMMRNQVAGFDPSEEEFMKVFKLRESFDSEFSPMTRMSENDEQKKAREAAEKQLKDNIKTTLGEQRYADYERAQDWNYQQIHLAARKGGLGTAEATKVHDMKKIAEKEANNVRLNQNLTPEQKSEALQGIQHQTETSIKAVLGEKGWEQYNRGGTTGWLRGMR
jgi:hypothetical protein